jgi:hypothetical protein
MRAVFTGAVVLSAMVWYAVLQLQLRKVRMKNRLGFLKTTFAGGIVFLIPVVSEEAPDIALRQKVGIAQGV